MHSSKVGLVFKIAIQNFIVIINKVPTQTIDMLYIKM